MASGLCRTGFIRCITWRPWATAWYTCASVTTLFSSCQRQGLVCRSDVTLSMRHVLQLWYTRDILSAVLDIWGQNLNNYSPGDAWLFGTSMSGSLRCISISTASHVWRVGTPVVDRWWLIVAMCCRTRRGLEGDRGRECDGCRTSTSERDVHDRLHGVDDQLHMDVSVTSGLSADRTEPLDLQGNHGCGWQLWVYRWDCNEGKEVGTSASLCSL